MKWYSVKKYIPLKDQSYFITDSEYFYEGRLSHNGNWIDSSLECEIGNITHFCIPDPIEIEE